MTDDAADDDDDRLKSLRAVWLALPDEDPPERGLAELMAAARVKAEQMATTAESAKPSLWQRVLESLRRPPVLALATIMVLIGGAVLVGRHGDEMKSEQTIAPTQSAPEAPGPTAPPAEESRAADKVPALAPLAAPAAGSASSTNSAEATVPMGGEGGDIPGLVGGRAEPRAEPAKEPVERRASQTRPSRESRGTKAERPRDEADAPSGVMDDAELSKQDSPKTGATTIPHKTASSASSDGAKAATAAPVEAESAAPSINPLHKTARAAAARGDCDAARALVRKIAGVDPGYYKKRIIGDPALASCMKPEAPASGE